jgi:hypothetical protein
MDSSKNSNLNIYIATVTCRSPYHKLIVGQILKQYHFEPEGTLLCSQGPANILSRNTIQSLASRCHHVRESYDGQYEKYFILVCDAVQLALL